MFFLLKEDRYPGTRTRTTATPAVEYAANTPFSERHDAAFIIFDRQRDSRVVSASLFFLLFFFVSNGERSHFFAAGGV